MQAGLLCVLVPECGAVSMAADQTLISEREKEKVEKTERAGEQEMLSDISESHLSPAWVPTQPTERHLWARIARII